MSKLFRGKMLAALRQAYDAGDLVLEGGAAALRAPAAFTTLVDTLYEKAWVVYAKPPFGGAEQVVAYLGRYTHRVGLSNHRLLGIDAHGVRLRTRGDKTVTLPPEELLRRFLLHVLPKGYVKIRHFGLMASSHATTTLELARARLAALRPPTSEPRPTPTKAREPWWKRLAAITGIDVTVCPRCGRPGMLMQSPDPASAMPSPPAWMDTS
jgi:hypothetical protein